MANIKSMKKDLRRNAKAKTVNQAVRTSLKTYVKKVRTSDAETVTDAVKAAVKAFDKAAQRGIIHPNQAARRKSRAMKAANKVASTPVVAPVAEVKAAKTAKAPGKKAAKK